MRQWSRAGLAALSREGHLYYGPHRLDSPARSGWRPDLESLLDRSRGRFRRGRRSGRVRRGGYSVDVQQEWRLPVTPRRRVPTPAATIIGPAW